MRCCVFFEASVERHITTCQFEVDLNGHLWPLETEHLAEGDLLNIDELSC